MKVLLVADEECPALWDYYVPGRLADFDLILSCGDLKAEYLTFLVTMARCPVLYVRGNHDGRYDRQPPEGCDCIDGGMVEYNGYRFLGLGGCRRYHPGNDQYSEREMQRRIRNLRPKLKKYGVDVVVAHAPPRELGDLEDPAHWGFEAFRTLLDTDHPGWFLHGHVHLRYGADGERVRRYNGTTLINACERYVLELPERPVEPAKRGQLIWYARPKEKDPDSILRL